MFRFNIELLTFPFINYILVNIDKFDSFKFTHKFSIKIYNQKTKIVNIIRLLKYSSYAAPNISNFLNCRKSVFSTEKF